MTDLDNFISKYEKDYGETDLDNFISKYENYKFPELAVEKPVEKPGMIANALELLKPMTGNIQGVQHRPDMSAYRIEAAKPAPQTVNYGQELNNGTLLNTLKNLPGEFVKQGKNIYEHAKEGESDLLLDFVDAAEALTRNKTLKQFTGDAKMYRDRAPSNLSMEGEDISGRNLVEKSVYGLARMAPGMAGGSALNIVAPGSGLAFWALQGAGDSYGRMVDSGVNENIALPLSVVSGLIYGKLEELQLDQIAPGLSKAVGKSVAKGIQKTIPQLLKHGGKIGKEVSEELGQEITQTAFDNIGKELNDQIFGTKMMQNTDIRNQLENYWNTIKESVGPLALAHLGSHAAHGAVKKHYDAQKQNQEKLDDIPPVAIEEKEKPASNLVTEESRLNKPVQDIPVPETSATLEAQINWLKEGKKQAVLLTPEESISEIPEGMKTLETERGTFVYRPDLISEEQLKEAVKEDKVGAALGYGIERKPEGKEATGVVTVRDKNGTEKQAVVTDRENLPDVVDSAEKVADTNDTIQLENPEKVIEDRIKNRRGESLKQFHKETELINPIEEFIREKGGINKKGADPWEYRQLPPRLKGNYKTGMAADKMAQMLYDAGFINEPDASSMINGLIGKKLMPEKSIPEEKLNEMEKEYEKGHEQVGFKDLTEDSVFTKNGEQFIVKDKDEDSVTLEDGEVITLTKDEAKKIDIDKGSLKDVEADDSFDFGNTIEQVESVKKDEIGILYDKSFRDKNYSKKVKIADVSDDERKQLSEKTGLDLSKINSHIIDGNMIRHVDRKHGKDSSDKVKITKEDIQYIPQIIANPDKFYLAPRKSRKHDLDVIAYEKRRNGKYYYYEEARTGKGVLAGQTFYAEETTKTGGHGQGPSPYVQNEPSKDIIPQKQENVKSGKQPWEMTANALIQHQIERNKRKISEYQIELDNMKAPQIKGNLTRKKDFSDLRHAKEFTGKNKERYDYLSDAIIRLKNINQALITKEKKENVYSFHQEEIKKAPSEGKPVPPEVLKDYPELQEKQKTKISEENPLLTEEEDANDFQLQGEVMGNSDLKYKKRLAEDENKQFQKENQMDMFKEREKKQGGSPSGNAMAAIGASTFDEAESFRGPLSTDKKKFTDKINISELNPLKVKSAIDAFKQVFAPGTMNDTARKGARIIRTQLAHYAQKMTASRKSLEKAMKLFDKISIQDSLQFIDDVENGNPAKNSSLQPIANSLRKLLDSARENVQALGKGKLSNYYENYFPHIWKQHDKAANMFFEMMRKNPLEGSKSFLKKRTIMTTKEGIEKGLEPVSYNPIELTLLKYAEVEKYVMAHNILADLKEAGLLKFVPAENRKYAPSGYTEIKDNIATVYSPPVNIKEAYDKLMMDGLKETAESLGIDVERVIKMRGNKWGYAYSELNKIATRFAGPESILAHEIGHIIGYRYGLYDMLSNPPKKFKTGPKGGEHETDESKEKRRTHKAELRKLADLHYETMEDTVSEGFKKYVRKGAEKEAALLEALIHAPEKFKKVAPTIYKEFTKFLASHNELKPLLNIKPSLVLGVSSKEVPQKGITELGKFYAPEEVANILNNHLSPGFKKSKYAAVRTTYDILRRAGNTINQVNLAVSFFHGLNIMTDSIASIIGLGFRQVLASKGQRLQGIGSIAKGMTFIEPIVSGLYTGHKVAKVYQQELDQITDPELKTIVHSIILGGGRLGMDAHDFNNARKILKDTWQEIFKQGKVLKSWKLPHQTILAGLESSVYPVMEFVVPRMKFGVFAKLAQHELLRAKNENLDNDKLHQRLTEIWDNIDNRMGEVVYDNIFLDKTFKESLMLGIRSVGWTGGSIREYGGAVTDIPATKKRMERGDAWLSQKTAYAMGAAFTYGILGAFLTYLFTGKGPDEIKDYFFPPTGNENSDGSKERISLPTYAKDMFGYANVPVKTLQHKLHPLLSILAEAWNNEDFYGTEIRTPGAPIFEQAKEVVEYLSKQITPFSFKNFQQMKKSGMDTKKALALSASGIGAAPASITRSPAQKKMIEFIRDKIPTGTRTKAEFEKSQQRKELYEKARKGQNIFTSKNLNTFSYKELKRISKQSESTIVENQFKRLSLREALEVYELANDKEKKQMKNALIKKAQNYDYGKPDWKELKKEYERVTGERVRPKMSGKSMFRLPKIPKLR